MTGQRCQQFKVIKAIEPYSTITLDQRDWIALPAPGHDPDAFMYFQAESAVLISGDALWESRLAINFPELLGDSGFLPAAQALDIIEEIKPNCVIPGHGSPFTDVAGAVRVSRERLLRFAAEPEIHRRHAARALTMFHMLERQALGAPKPVHALSAWLARTPIFSRIFSKLDAEPSSIEEFAAETIDRLVVDRVLLRSAHKELLIA